MNRKNLFPLFLIIFFLGSSVLSFRSSKADTGFSPLPGYTFSVSKTTIQYNGDPLGNVGDGQQYTECYGAKVRNGSNQIEFRAHIIVLAQSVVFTLDKEPVFIQIFDPDTGINLTSPFSVDFPRIDCPAYGQRESEILLNFPFTGNIQNRLGVRVIGGLYAVPPNPTSQTQDFALPPGQNNRLIFSDPSSTGIFVSAFSGPDTDRICATCTRAESFTADPATIQAGQSSTLTWVISNPNENGFGDPVGEVRIRNLNTNQYETIPPSQVHNRRGSITVSPTTTTDYELEYTTGTCGDTLRARVLVNSGTARRGHFEVRYTPPQGADPAGNYPAAGTVWVGPTVECPDWSCSEYTNARNTALAQQNTLIAAESNRLGAINDARYQAYLTALAEWRAQYGGASTFDEARAWQLEQYAIAQQNYQGALNSYYANYCGNVPANCPAPGTTITGPMATPYYTFLFPTRMATPKNVSSSFP